MVRRASRRPATLDLYLDHLRQRWDEGEHNAKILHQELLTKGYLGHYQRVKIALVSCPEFRRVRDPAVSAAQRRGRPRLAVPARPWAVPESWWRTA
ncbi:hypothetical protein GCM10027073_56810 [Streptomyces chlorus]